MEMKKIALFAVKAPFLVAASVALPALGLVTLPITVPIGLLWAKRANDIVKEAEAADQEDAASLMVPIADILTMVPSLGFVVPVFMWQDAFAELRG